MNEKARLSDMKFGSRVFFTSFKTQFRQSG